MTVQWEGPTTLLHMAGSPELVQDEDGLLWKQRCQRCGQVLGCSIYEVGVWWPERSELAWTPGEGWTLAIPYPNQSLDWLPTGWRRCPNSQTLIVHETPRQVIRGFALGLAAALGIVFAAIAGLILGSC